MQRCCCCEDFRLWCSQNVVFQGAGSLAKSAAEREGGFSEFSYLQSLFLHSSGKFASKKTAKWTKTFYWKTSETLFQVFIWYAFLSKVLRITVSNPPSHITLWEESLASVCTGQASCRANVSNSIIQSGTCDACMDMTLNSSSSTGALLRTSNSSQSLWGEVCLGKCSLILKIKKIKHLRSLELAER